MTINVGDVHTKLQAAGIPIHGVALNRPNKPGISIDFKDEATKEQRLEAQLIVADYDQEAEDAAKPAPAGVLTAEEINNAKSVQDVKALLLKLFPTKE